MENQLVGVTRYCDFPKEATKKTKIGGFLDVNFEQIVTLQPSLVILTEENKNVSEKLEKLGINTLSVKVRSASGIISSIRQIGQECGKSKSAEQFATKLEQELHKLENSVSKLKTKKVLIAVGRTRLESASRSVYLSGADGFYNDLLP